LTIVTVSPVMERGLEPAVIGSGISAEPPLQQIGVSPFS
tara:strand:- start:15816 stop:15932 length:117 start_codon:yes stop_codon:yes gene_type:complete